MPLQVTPPTIHFWQAGLYLLTAHSLWAQGRMGGWVHWWIQLPQSHHLPLNTWACWGASDLNHNNLLKTSLAHTTFQSSQWQVSWALMSRNEVLCLVVQLSPRKWASEAVSNSKTSSLGKLPEAFHSLQNRWGLSHPDNHVSLWHRLCYLERASEGPWWSTPLWPLRPSWSCTPCSQWDAQLQPLRVQRESWREGRWVRRTYLLAALAFELFPPCSI